MIKLLIITIFLSNSWANNFLSPGYIDLTDGSSKLTKLLNEIFQNNTFQEEYLIQKIKNFQSTLGAIEKSLCPNEECGEELKKNNDYQAVLKIIDSLEKAKNLGENILYQDINKPSSQLFLHHLFYTYQLEEALNNGGFISLRKSPPELFNYIGSKFISQKPLSGKTESNNLLNEKKEFIPPALSKNLDSSLLEPSASALWKKPTWEVGAFELHPLSYDEILPLEDTLKFSLLDPHAMIKVTLDETANLMGYLPEITVLYAGEKWILRFPFNIQDIQVGTEIKNALDLFFESNLINANPVTLNMARAVGFNVEPVIFKEKIRLVFNDSKNFLEKKGHLLERLNKKFPGKNFALPFFNHQVDENTGEEYFEIKGITLQRINQDKVGVGVLSSPLRMLKREYRGLALFLAWIDDISFEELDILLDGSERISDLSLSLGRGLPNYFSDQLIKKEKIMFKPLKSEKILSTITRSDALWMLKLISEFTPEQLKQGFLNYGFPDLISQIFVRKLMSRRNQLIDLLAKGGFKKEEGWEGKISGFENYFTKDGKFQDFKHTINDNNKESYPINWSSTWYPLKGDANRSSLKKLSLSLLNQALDLTAKYLQLAAGFSNKEFKWQEIRYMRHLYGPLCSGNCFFQGVESGATAFIPQRVLIKNPDSESSKKYLILEIFRLAVEAHLGQNIEHLLGLAPLPIKIGGGVSSFYVYEFFRIKPVENISSLNQDIKGLFKLPLYTFRNFKKEWIDSADENDILILSSYLGIEGDLLAGPPAIGGALSFFTGFNSRLALTNRLVLKKMKENIFHANWGTLKESELSVILGYNLLKITDDIWLRGKLHWSKRKEDVYEFNISNLKEREILEKNLTNIFPKNIPQTLKLKRRFKNTMGASFFMGLAESFSYSIISEYGKQNIYDYLENKDFKENYFTRVKMKKFNGEYFETYKTSLDENNNTRLKIIYALTAKDMTPEKLETKKDDMENILGSTVIPYDVDKIDPKMGMIKFWGMILFKPQAINKILSLDNIAICKSYLSAQEDEINFWRCQQNKYTPKMAAFLKDFDQIKKSQNKKRKYWYLKHFTDILSRYSAKRGTAKILKSFLEPEDYFEIAFMLSDRSPFPGNTSEIILIDPKNKDFSPSIPELADSSEESFSLFSDKITNALKEFFYVRERIKSVNRTEEIMEDIFSKIKFSYR